MKKVKILHCGDLHFDTPFCQLSSIESEKRKEDLRETFGRIIGLVKEEKIPILLISGDLFDNERVMKTTLDYMIKKFNEIKDTRVLISPGNHDPHGSKSFYTMMKWPQNVHIFGPNIEKVSIGELNTCIYGIGFSRNHEKRSLIEKFSVEDDEAINIMVLHGQVVSKGQDSDYNPITIEDIQKSKLDYLALGHCHGHNGIVRDGNTFWSYSGNPEGRGFDELGPKGVIIGEVGKGYNNLHFKRICKRQYIEVKIDITGARTYEEIVEMINKEIMDGGKNLYKIILTGEIPEGFNINISIIKEKLKTFYFIKIIDETRIGIDYTSLENTYSLKGIFIKNIRKKIEKAKDIDEKKQLERALKIGLNALDGGIVNDY